MREKGEPITLRDRARERARARAREGEREREREREKNNATFIPPIVALLFLQ
jgi:hypothetical protein